MGERGRKKRDPVDTVDNQRGRLLINRIYRVGHSGSGGVPDSGNAINGARTHANTTILQPGAA